MVLIAFIVWSFFLTWFLENKLGVYDKHGYVFVIIFVSVWIAFTVGMYLADTLRGR